MTRDRLLQRANRHCRNPLINAGADFPKAEIPVAARVWQPMGLMHGNGAATLAKLTMIVTDVQKVPGNAPAGESAAGPEADGGTG